MHFLLTIFVALSLSVCVQARDLPVINTGEPVRFATSTFTPWGIYEPGQPASGLLVDVMRDLISETGIPVKNQMLPYPRVIHSLYSGGVDMAVLFDSPEARESALYVGHVVDTRILIIARADREPVTSIADLKGKTIGFLRGSKYGQQFDESNQIRRTAINSMFQGLAMVLRNRLYAMAGTDQSVYWAMEKMKVDPSKLTVLMDFKGPSGGLYMSRFSSRQDLLLTYRYALEELHRKGSMKAIFERDYKWSHQQENILPTASDNSEPSFPQPLSE
jgi:polar amino acid transport system substrate-binding protein